MGGSKWWREGCQKRGRLAGWAAPGDEQEVASRWAATSGGSVAAFGTSGGRHEAAACGMDGSERRGGSQLGRGEGGAAASGGEWHRRRGVGQAGLPRMGALVAS